jgi:hypothetical protein
MSRLQNDLKCIFITLFADYYSRVKLTLSDSNALHQGNPYGDY